MDSAHPIIKNTDDFQPSEFPEALKELAAITEATKALRHADTGMIVVSYVKDHMVRSDLVPSHSQLVKLLTSKGTCHFLEDLFFASRQNAQFRFSLEKYVLDHFDR